MVNYGFFGTLRLGKEIVEVLGADGPVGFDEPGVSFVALAGTGFDPDNDQHRLGSDALRYAIAIQQRRDDCLFTEADAIRDAIKGSYDVGTAKGRTVVCPKSARRMMSCRK